MEIEKRINEVKNDFKFVQVYLINGLIKEPIIRVSDFNHSKILERLLREFKISFETRMGKERKYSIPIENKNGSYKIVGAGKFKVLDEGKIGYYSNSYDYDLRPNHEHFKEMEKHQEFKFVEMDSLGENVLS